MKFALKISDFEVDWGGSRARGAWPSQSASISERPPNGTSAVSDRAYTRARIFARILPRPVLACRFGVVGRKGPGLQLLPHRLGNGKPRPTERLRHPLGLAQATDRRGDPWIAQRKMQRRGPGKAPVGSEDRLDAAYRIQHRFGRRLLIDVAGI